jgi:hypothetical protein
MYAKSIWKLVVYGILECHLTGEIHKNHETPLSGYLIPGSNSCPVAGFEFPMKSYTIWAHTVV